MLKVANFCAFKLITKNFKKIHDLKTFFKWIKKKLVFRRVDWESKSTTRRKSGKIVKKTRSRVKDTRWGTELKVYKEEDKGGCLKMEIREDFLMRFAF